MPLQPSNRPAPAVASGKIRVWDFINTQLYYDINISTIYTWNIVNSTPEQRVNAIKEQVLEYFRAFRPSYTWYGTSYLANVNDKSRMHLVFTKGSGNIGRYVFSSQNSGDPGWTDHSLFDMYNPGIVAGGTHNSFQSGDEFKLIYVSPEDVQLNVSGFKDTTNWFNIYPERKYNASFCWDWTEFNGIYTIVDPISRQTNPRDTDATDVSTNNSGIGWKWWGSQNDPYYYSNPDIKKLKWEKFLSEGGYGWRKAEVTWKNGRYVLREHTSIADSSNRHEYKIMATSPAPAMAFPYNEDMLVPSMLQWTPVNLMIGTGGYITVNSKHKPRSPAPLPKGVRLGGGLKVNANSKIKFKF
jgi:hypothetical protein